MKLFMMRRGFRLEPVTPESQEILERIPERKLIEVDAVQRRNAAHNALYWSMLHRIAGWLGQTDVTPEVLHDFMKLEAGIYCQVRLPNGDIKKIPGSTAFASMDQVAFTEFFETAVQTAYAKLGVPPQLLADLLTPGLETAA
jgi:hypothetical protein